MWVHVVWRMWCVSLFFSFLLMSKRVLVWGGCCSCWGVLLHVGRSCLSFWHSLHRWIWTFFPDDNLIAGCGLGVMSLWGPLVTVAGSGRWRWQWSINDFFEQCWQFTVQLAAQLLCRVAVLISIFCLSSVGLYDHRRLQLPLLSLTEKFKCT